MGSFRSLTSDTSRRETARVATCPLCEAMCGVLVEVDGQRIQAVRGDPDDPFSRGYVCPKAAALVDLQHDPDRVRAPLVRTGSDWRETSWEEALDRAAGGLASIRRRHGRDAVALYYGNPVAHNLGIADPRARRSGRRSEPETSTRRARPINCRRCWPRCACSGISG